MYSESGAVPCGGVLGAKSYMDPAKRQQVLLVLVTEQFLDVLHVTEIGTSRLFRDHDMSQHELIVCLRVKTLTQIENLEYRLTVVFGVYVDMGLTSRPQRTPQVSIPRAVFESARMRKRDISSLGRTTHLRPSTL